MDVTEAREVSCPVCAKRIAAGQRVSNRALRGSQKAEAVEETVEEASEEEPTETALAEAEGEVAA